MSPKQFKGCSHKKLWTETCYECKLVWYEEGLRTAMREVEKYRQQIEHYRFLLDEEKDAR